MQGRFDDFFTKVMEYEGRVCEDVPLDPGGPTKWGITIFDYAESVGKRVPARGTHDFEAMKAALFACDPSWIEDVYKKKYWDKVRADELPSGVDWVVADFGVNSGVSRAVKLLQRLCGRPETGSMDDETVAATRAHQASELIETYCDERARFLRAIVASRPSQMKFLRGWLSRVDDVRKNALRDADKAAVFVSVPKAVETFETTTTSAPKEAVKSKSVWALITGAGAWATEKVKSTWDALPDITSNVQAQLDPLASLAHLLKANISAILGTVTVVCIAIAIYRHANDKAELAKLKGDQQ